VAPTTVTSTPQSIPSTLSISQNTTAALTKLIAILNATAESGAPPDIPSPALTAVTAVRATAARIGCPYLFTAPISAMMKRIFRGISLRYSRMLVSPPNDLRISCKRLARVALTYVPPPAVGGWRTTEPHPDALIGCMRGLGGAAERSRYFTPDAN
jgi:hypothetical protein